ncbi:MAG: cyclic nucleotide-binding domain-containing protein [Chitinivibrionales bacterium]|nr:cyclic nucleotide-binding domain-containing protein [Chitinivibrionales bacterium]
MPDIGRSELKTGKRPQQLNIQTFKPGTTLFEEGTRGKELFIIKEGRVGVYKTTSDGEIELAVLGDGALVGEMSLLDNLPRSATVRAIDTTKALLINSAVFQATMQKVPVWLFSIVKIVVSRLRDANKRVDLSILRDKEHGVVSLMLLLLPKYKHEFASLSALDYDFMLVETYYVCQLKKKEITHLISGLEKSSIVQVEEDTNHKKHICIKDIDVLKLFKEYLVLKSQRKEFRELGVPEEALSVLNNIAYVAQKSGSNTDEGTALLKSVLLKDLTETKPEKLDRVLLDLKRRNLINMFPVENDVKIIFQRETLARIKKIKEWAPRFEKGTGGA